MARKPSAQRASSGNRALVASRVASLAQAAAPTPVVAQPLGYRVEAPDWLESFDGMSAPPTPGENGYGPEPSLAGMPYGAVGGVGAAVAPTSVTDPTSASASSAASNGASAQPLTSDAAYNWVVAWLVLIILLAVIVRTRLGYVIVYYVLALSLLFLLVTNAQWIAAALAPFNSMQQKVSGQ